MDSPKKDAAVIKKKRPPAHSLEARENQLISLAVDLAEKQLIEGTASSQVIAHYLKLGSMTSRVEREILVSQKELIQAKTDAMKSAKRVDVLYEEALKAMRNYTGKSDGEEEQ